MRHIIVLLSVLALLPFISVRAEEAPKKKEPAATTPAIKDPGFVKRHEGFVAEAKKGGHELVFIGDSITDGWRGGGKKVWEAAFAPLKPLNLGIGGDRTQHVLWRMQNGELEGYEAKLAVIMIGTNNGPDSKEDVAAGITAIVKEVQKHQPKAKILLLGIFPRAPRDEKSTSASLDNPANKKNMAVNEIVAKLDDGGKTIKYMDIGDKFLDADKKLPKDVMPDYLHPNAKGYQIWADAILPTVKEMMGAK